MVTIGGGEVIVCSRSEPFFVLSVGSCWRFVVLSFSMRYVFCRVGCDVGSVFGFWVLGFRFCMCGWDGWDGWD